MNLVEVADRLRKLQDPKAVGVVYDGTLEVFDDKDIEAFNIAEKIVSELIVAAVNKYFGM